MLPRLTEASLAPASDARAMDVVGGSQPYATVVALWWLTVAASGLIVLGSKLWLITNYGSPTPFWDQWDAEAAFLYDPYLSGKLPLSTFFAPHNEHRLLATRLIATGLLELAGHWDVILQMFFNATLHTGVLIVLLYLLRDLVGKAAGMILAVFSAFVFAIPFGWENTLEGFGNQFYLEVLFSLLSLSLTVGGPVNTSRWWSGVALSVLSFFSLASGALTPVIGAAIAALQIAVGRRRGIVEFVGMGLQLILAGIMMHATPTLEIHAPLRAHSISQYVDALWVTTSWPLPVSYIAPFVVFAPLILLAIRTFRGPRALRAAVWLALAIGGWVVAQDASLAYGRAVGVNSSRYVDLKSLALIINLAALIDILQGVSIKAGRLQMKVIAVIGLPALWLAVVCISLGTTALGHLPAAIAQKAENGRAETENLRLFLRTGNPAALTGKAPQAIPYPDPERLASVASLPMIRGILPPDLVDDPSARDAAERQLWTRAKLRRIAGWLHRLGEISGPYMMFLGLGVLFAVGLTSSLDLRRSQADSLGRRG